MQHWGTLLGWRYAGCFRQEHYLGERTDNIGWWCECWGYPFFSRPTAIAKDLFSLFSSGKIYPHILMTMKEVFAGLFLGTLTGMITGIVLGKKCDSGTGTG